MLGSDSGVVGILVCDAALFCKW